MYLSEVFLFCWINAFAPGFFGSRHEMVQVNLVIGINKVIDGFIESLKYKVVFFELICGYELDQIISDRIELIFL